MFGRQLIERLIPHRSPFLMIDTVVAFDGGNPPWLHAEFSVRRSEPVFSRGEPPPRWPALYVIEGLAQCGSLLSVIGSWPAHHGAQSLSVEAARNPYRTPEADDFSSDLWSETLRDAPNMVAQMGMLASIDVEVTGTVGAGDLLRYEIVQTHVVGGMHRFEAAAFVGSMKVAKGTLVGARLEGAA